jgi:hypothetical protein
MEDFIKDMQPVVTPERVINKEAELYYEWFKQVMENN